MKQLEQKGLELRSAAEGMQITNQSDRNNVAEFLVYIKTKQKEVESAMDPQCKAAYESWQTALKQKKQYLAPYVEAEGIVKGIIGKYDLEQQERQEEADRKAREEAEKAEAKERARLEKLAAKHEAKGNEEKAEEYRERAEDVYIPAVTTNHTPQKSEGVTSKRDFDIEVVDKVAFLKWMLDLDVDLTGSVSFKLGAVKQYINLAQLKKVPGLNLKPKAVISAKAR